MIKNIKFKKNGTADVTCSSDITGNITTKNIKITEQQYTSWKEESVLIQNAVPHLSIDDREFLISGITNKEWNIFIKDK